MRRFQKSTVAVLSGALALGAIGVGGAGASVVTKYPKRACGELEAAASAPQSGDAPSTQGFTRRAEIDSIDAVPAATLLLPYFEVSLNPLSKSKEPGGKAVGKQLAKALKDFDKSLNAAEKALDGPDESKIETNVANANEAGSEALDAVQAALDWCAASAVVIPSLEDACAQLRINVYSFDLNPDEFDAPQTPADGINVYSFALHPELHQPSGTTNLSRIDNAIIESAQPGANAVGKALDQVLRSYERFANRVRFADDSAKGKAKNLAKAESALSDVQDAVQETLQWCDEIVPAETTPDPGSTTNNRPQSNTPAQPHTTTTTYYEEPSPEPCVDENNYIVPCP